MSRTLSAPRGRPKDAELPQRRRDQILDAASDFFARHGYHEADIQQLADRLGVGKGTIYRYFPSKESLFLAATDRVMRLLRERMDKIFVEEKDPLDRLRRSTSAYLAFFEAHPQFVELIILERAVFKNRKKPTYFEHREKNIVRWFKVFRELISEGRVRSMPVEQILDVISNAVYGTMFTNFFAGRKKAFETQAGEILDVVFHGIVKGAHPKASGRMIRKGRSR